MPAPQLLLIVPHPAAIMSIALHGNIDVTWDVSTVMIYDWGRKKMVQQHGVQIIKVISGMDRT
jgi:hypothetical protein